MKTQTMVELTFPPFPVYTCSAYRRFVEGEYHLTRTFGEYVLLIVIDGTLRFTEDGKEIEVTAGQWYLQRPNLLQSATCASDKPYYYYLHFRMPDENPWQIAPCRYLPQTLTMPIRGICDWRLYEYYFWQLENYPILDLESLTHVQKLFLEFFRLFLDTAVDENSKLSPAVRDMIQFIRERYTAPNIMELLTERFHYSSDHLRKKFKQETGRCPSEYQAFIRVEHARWQLNATSLTIEEIGAKVGWTDTSTFIRNFRRFLGCSPTQWRMREKDL